MPDEIVHVIEDAFHRLQHPQPGSSSTDEDLANAAQVTVWNCQPGLRGRVHASARNGLVTLSGTVENEVQRSAIEGAVSRLNGVDGVDNEIEVAGAPEPGDEKSASPATHHQLTSEPMLYVTRYCGVEPYSLTAALHGAVDVLDRRFAQLGLPVPEDVVVIYRNRLPESVALDIGYALPASAQVESDDDLRLGHTPTGVMLAAAAPFGSRRLFEAHDQLVQQARLADLAPATFAWQRFPLKAARRRADRPAAPLYLPVNSSAHAASAA